ncbi:glycine betaine/choline ABC transporter membrane protein [Klebsiella pneumoniae]|uniref:Glycine betaine/choline ABC transporter membrane protein n=1 Tax=Klebsiella pneumoniae TaxID=573 RepID=A0A447RL65_KLEPN|nr:glycine betaine/choline ABC transporter membrane protein [Klebsiella pneumoniae]
MKMATTWSGALALAALISLPLQAAEPVKVGSKIDTEGALLGNMIPAGAGKPRRKND